MGKIEQGSFNRFEAAQYLGIAPKTFDKLLATGQIYFRRIGKAILVSKVVLDRWLEGEEANETKSLPDM